MSRRLIFYPEFFSEEESTPGLYDDFDTDQKFLHTGRISPGSGLDEQFNAFLDGSMKLYRIASAYKTGTPLYVGSVSAVLLVRGKDRLLKESGYSRTANIVLFPVDAYRRKIADLPDTEAKALLEDFLQKLNRVVAGSGSQLFREQDLGKDRQGVMRVFGRSGHWILCDTTFKGITEPEGDLIATKDLFNAPRVKEAARSKVRYILALLEFYCLYSFLNNNKDQRVLVDGLIPPLHRLTASFSNLSQSYPLILDRVVGFIKHPRKVPGEHVDDIMTLREGDYRLFTGSGSETEVYGEKHGEDTGQHFIFGYMRFRSIPFFDQGPVGIVKLQLGRPEKSDFAVIERLLHAVYRERIPYPSSRERFFNEPFPIEETEKVAKSRLSSEEEVRGFMYSILPYSPY